MILFISKISYNYKLLDINQQGITYERFKLKSLLKLSDVHKIFAVHFAHICTSCKE